MWAVRRAAACAAGLLTFGGAAAAQQPFARLSAGAGAGAVARCAIARRAATLAGAATFAYDAATRMVVRDADLPPDSVRSIVFIGEARTTQVARYPGAWQETVLARRQSFGVGAQRNAVGVRDIADIGGERTALTRGLSFGPGGGGRGSLGRGGEGWRRGSGEDGDVSVASPLAADAPSRYDFRMLDTLVVDGRAIVRLAVVPRSGSAPLFVGTLQVAESTCDVVAADFGVTDAVRFNSVTDLRYQERWADVGGGRWLPVEIRLSGEARPRITGPRLPEEVARIPVPRLPGHVRFEQTASLDSFRFGVAAPRSLGEYRIVVRPGADRRDDSTWTAPGAAPPTSTESAAWARSDSIERRPPTFLMKVRDAVAVGAALAADPGIFHYNRVDGVYLGAARDWTVASSLSLRTSLGYGTGSEQWQYEVGGRYRLSRARRAWLSWSWHDATASWPTLVSGGYNPTYRALFAQLDPLNYYRERGLDVGVGTSLLERTRLDLGYTDAAQSSLPVVVGIGGGRRPIRPNPPIAGGRLRELRGSLSWDSRLLLDDRGVDRPLGGSGWTRITVGAALSEPGLLASDFAYRRYTLDVQRQQRTLWGTTTVSGAAGVATGDLPPQRYFTVDFGMEFLTFQGNGFNTLGGTDFSGDRAAMVVVRHDFDRTLFNLPFTFSVHGGAFWTAFVGQRRFYAANLLLDTAPRAYTEAGFGIGNLTPFLSPFDLAVHFTWQLSSYPTRRFRFGFSLGSF